MTTADLNQAQQIACTKRKVPQIFYGTFLSGINLYQTMVRHCDATWHQLLCSLLPMVEKLEKLGFVYCNGEVMVVEIVEDGKK